MGQDDLDTRKVVRSNEFDLVSYGLGFLFRLDEDMGAGWTPFRAFRMEWDSKRFHFPVDLDEKGG